MKEKGFLKWLALRASIILMVYLVAQIAVILIRGYDLSEPLIHGWMQGDYETDEIDVMLSEDGIVEIKDVWKKGRNIWITVSPVCDGEVYLEAREKETGNLITTEDFEVRKVGLIVSLTNENFSGYQLTRILLTLLAWAYAGLLWVGFFKAQKLFRYSYRSIFAAGFGIWALLISIMFTVFTLLNVDMYSVYKILKNAPQHFLIVTFIPVLVFSVILIISNLKLIRREGFRLRNATGIFLAFLLVGGAIALSRFDDMFSVGSDFQMRVYAAILNSLTCIYALFECFLIGSIVLGIVSAKHEPPLDMDYIVILGCRIRKDGTLYPLIRSRVDRALEFYRKQLAKTGKKAVFVPSGGRGKDEPISKADAMKRYLMEQGIEENRIISENRSQNTRENMQFSKALIDARGGGKAAFATTNFHVFRGGIVSRQVNFEAEGMGSKTKWYFWPNAFVREVFGMARYQWKTLILVLLPLIAVISLIQFAF